MTVGPSRDARGRTTPRRSNGTHRTDPGHGLGDRGLEDLALPARAGLDLLVSDTGAALWLGEGAWVPEAAGETWTSDEAAGQLRSRRPNDRVRTTYAPAGGDAESTVQVAVTQSAGGGTTLRFHQERLAGPEERERQRGHWQQVVQRIEVALQD